MLRGSVKTVRALIWAMLQPHHPTLTIADVSGLIDQAGGFEGLTGILEQAATAGGTPAAATGDAALVGAAALGTSKPTRHPKRRLRTA